MHRTISILLAAVMLLVCVGLIMLFSASIGHSEDSLYFILRQLIWMGVSLVGAAVCARIDLRWFQKLAIPLVVICVLALICVRIPGIGHDVKGSWRWIQMGPLKVQPSEFAKVGMIFAAAWWIARRRRYMHTFKRGILVPMLGLGLFAVLFLVEPDFGTTVLTGLVIVTMLFAGGASVLHLAGFGAVGVLGFAVLLIHNPNRMARIASFLDPEAHVKDGAWQLVNALDAFGAGGASGVGLGNSIQKHYYLPEAHTDFIFAILGEELGLAASLIILLLFFVVFVCGLHIAARANDDFGRFTALGCTLMITLQALINFAVVTGSMPTKGLALPFISYGGSSLLVCSCMIGILVNVAHTARSPKAKKRNALFKDKKRKA
jgi:cell division protein FtsW